MGTGGPYLTGTGEPCLTDTGGPFLTSTVGPYLMGMEVALRRYDIVRSFTTATLFIAAALYSATSSITIGVAESWGHTRY